jgi:spermidine dehydrogenase
MPDRPANAVTRRDFLNGLPLGIGAAGLLPGGIVPGLAADAAPQDAPGYYPPALTGLRGSHAGSFEVAHRLRDGAFRPQAGDIKQSGESYDLIVVGGGISGLAAAHFWCRQHAGARVLILDNHDDFGGHAKRNEFTLGGKRELINGGTLSIDSPKPYSAVADTLLKTLGIDPVALSEKYWCRDYYSSLGLRRGIFLDKETFGADHLIVAADGTSWAERLASSPLAPQVRRDIARIEDARIDYMPGLTSDQKKRRLAKMSYRDFLLDVVKADPGVVAFYQARTHGEWGVGIDAVAALDVWAFDFPGFQGLDLKPGAVPGQGYTAAGYAETGGSHTFHFPDGNASIARLLVRDLIADAVPGSSAEDAVTARIDYAKLDRAASPVRIRLSSTAVRVRNVGDPASAKDVEVAYARGGEVYAVRGSACVLACWNMVIPYLCPDLPQPQRQALHYGVKTPLVYANVGLSNWRAFKALGVSQVHAPGAYFSSVSLNFVVDIGDYASPRSPDEPMLLRLVRTPCRPGLPERDQHRAGHYDILNTSFEAFEHNLRGQLGRILSPGGFDADRDIAAIAVNRWPHGYAYEYNPLFDPDWPDGQAPNVIGRARFGRIAIANSDAGAAAYTDSAIDQAYRAVQDLA